MSVNVNISDTDAAYFAALIDGEGCIDISKRMAKGGINPSYRCEIKVANNYYGVIWEMHQLWGGFISPKRDNRHFHLVLSHTDGRKALLRCMKYLRIKPTQALLWLECSDTFYNWSGDRSSLYRKREELRQALMERPFG